MLLLLLVLMASCRSAQVACTFSCCGMFVHAVVHAVVVLLSESAVVIGTHVMQLQT
jgi:hypothetical protein